MSLINALTIHRKAFIARRQQQAGISMLDFLVYIGVAVVIITLVLYVAGVVRGRADVLNAEQDIVSLAEATRAAYATQSTYGTADITTYLANSNDTLGSLRKTVSGSTVTLTNKWNGSVAVVGANSSFNLTYNTMPKAICNKILPRLLSPNWLSVTVGSTALALPISPPAADAACAASNNLTLVAS
jgi:type II secretory pathway pseudopilin PulG